VDVTNIATGTDQPYPDEFPGDFTRALPGAATYKVTVSSTGFQKRFVR